MALRFKESFAEGRNEHHRINSFDDPWQQYDKVLLGSVHYSYLSRMTFKGEECPKRPTFGKRRDVYFSVPVLGIRDLWNFIIVLCPALYSYSCHDLRATYWVVSILAVVRLWERLLSRPRFIGGKTQV